VRTIIRKATQKDAQAICNIWEIIAAERKHSAISKPFTLEQEINYVNSLSEREAIFLAEVDGEIAGFQSIDCFAKYIESMNHVATVGTYVLPEYRGKGMGEALFEKTLEFARNQGYEKFVIYVRASNTGAQAFYSRFGFEPKRILKKQVKINGTYDDEIFMEMFL